MSCTLDRPDTTAYLLTLAQAYKHILTSEMHHCVATALHIVTLLCEGCDLAETPKPGHAMWTFRRNKLLT